MYTNATRRVEEQQYAIAEGIQEVFFAIGGLPFARFLRTAPPEHVQIKHALLAEKHIAYTQRQHVGDRERSQQWSKINASTNALMPW